MPITKKITTTLKVFIFLALTLGILWVSLAVQKRIQEGFQAAGCSTQTVAGRKTYLCPTESAAQALYTDSNITLADNDAICYTDTTNLDPTVTAGGSKYYVCYTRPAPQVFDTIYGVNRDIDVFQDEDQAPESEYSGINLTQSAYTNGYANILKSYVNISTLYNSVTGYGLSNVKYGLNTLNTIKDQRCQTPANLATYSNVCTSAQAGIDSLNGILTRTDDQSLSRLSTMLLSSMNTISTVVFDTLEPAFYDAGVMKPDRIAAYIDARRP